MVNALYMYFILALFPHKKHTYSIHGLWPQYSKDSWPDYCSNVPFKMDKIVDLLPELKEYWWSYDGKNEHFWKHEFEKHGTCSNMNEHQYFRTALDCYYKYKKEGIIEHYRHGKTIKIVIHKLQF